MLGWVGRDLRSGARILGVAPVLQCGRGCLEQTWGPLCSQAGEVAGAEPNAKALPWGMSVAEKPCDRCSDASFVACDVSFSLHPSTPPDCDCSRSQGSLLRFLYPTEDADRVGDLSTAVMMGSTHQQWGKQPLSTCAAPWGVCSQRSLLPVLCRCQLRMDNLSSTPPWCTLHRQHGDV